jgi:hypothetical protein
MRGEAAAGPGGSAFVIFFCAATMFVWCAITSAGA